jgi:glycosyltransferase involved in cell wall biosynthesis
MVPSRKDASVLAQAVAPARIRTWVVPSGVDTEHIAPQARAERTHDAVFVGSLGWHPNRAAVERIAALVPHLTRELGRAPRIRIVGRSAGFESVLRPLLAVPELEFCGFVPDARVEMARARVLLAPLAYGGGTKLKVLNALACGLPVVTSAAGAEGLEVGEADGVYVREGAEALARETARLVRDDVAWRAASAAARHAAASRFSWHAVASALRQAVRGATPALEAAR